ncbi:MAG TPA: M2 family metallopeptidase [Thermoanaerobaculia bacterium]|nr:M2 family metallopeptidase [Thermoanaerobaculia bacterium]
MDSKSIGRAWLLALALLAAAFPATAQQAATATAAAKSTPTVAEAQQFMDAAEKRLLDLSVEAGRAAWVQANFITDDTQALAAVANDRLIAAATELAQGAERFAGLQLPPELARKMMLLKIGLTLPAPADAAKRAELTKIAAAMEAAYGAGKWCPAGKSSAEDCLDIGELSKVLAESRDPAKLQEAWTRWHSISPPIKKDFVRYVELANEGARELGFKDVGAMWRSKYDMPPDAFAAELDRLWGQVKPFYDSLHCYVRAELNKKYGDAVQPKTGPIRADLLGNMWAQEWGNVYDVVSAPVGTGSSVDVTKLLEQHKVDALGMVKIGERFYTSLGFDPLPQTFWKRSLFTQPRDRDVVCHASAWSIDYQDDLRIKMCIEPTGEDLVTIHHELGHNFYQRAYNKQPFLFQDSANDGFHEAIGDTIALSVTPEYLKEIGLLDKVPPAGNDTPQLLRMALDKIAFLPFGLLIDQWRWKVFSGEITPEHYNQAWWDLRLKYQGVAPPVARTEADFDPAAKYHVAANVPYTRYFLARILQFQFQRALCRIAGDKGPLHRCSIYGSKEAGRRLNEMLSMGLSKPWPEALQALTGESRIDATAIQDYFAPLKTWLDGQNKGRQCGW